MTHYFVATSSVHVTAAAADYLIDRLVPDDEVTVVAVRDPGPETGAGSEHGSPAPGSPSRDAGDAVNVARSRLAAAAPETAVREGDPTAELLTAIEERDPDEVVLGVNRGTEDAGGVGETARALLAALDRPVVVVPLPDL